MRALYNRNCGLRTEWLGSSFRGQSEAGHSGRGRRYGTWSHRPSTTADYEAGAAVRSQPGPERMRAPALRAPHLHPSTQSGDVGNCGLRTEWLGSSFRGQSEAGHSGRRRRYGTWSHRPSTTADTKPGLQGEASPDLQRTTSTSTESTAPAPEHPVRNRVGSELLFRDCNPLVLLLVIPIAG
ncbi:UNVERIFIED_CONTAM: hypothetical protein FKN15_003969 [Acipenser sinensis]